MINKDRGICPIEFKDATDGSWVASFKVENKEIWDAIKNSNTLNGFSLSGVFAMEPANFNKEVKLNDFEEIIDELIK